MLIDKIYNKFKIIHCTLLITHYLLIMSSSLLFDRHNFRNGDEVTITDRFSNESYQGTIDRILCLPENEKLKQYNIVDYFYIRFNKNIYDILLKRGWNIIYKNQKAVLGNIIRNIITQNIEKLYIQYSYSYVETEINLEDINSILIWRINYKIE